MSLSELFMKQEKDNQELLNDQCQSYDMLLKEKKGMDTVEYLVKQIQTPEYQALKKGAQL